MAIIYPSIATGDFASTKTANNFSGSQTISGNLNVTGSSTIITSTTASINTKTLASFKANDNSNGIFDSGFLGAGVEIHFYDGTYGEIDLVTKGTDPYGGVWLEAGPVNTTSASFYLQNTGDVDLFSKNTTISGNLTVTGSNVLVKSFDTTITSSNFIVTTPSGNVNDIIALSRTGSYYDYNSINLYSRLDSGSVQFEEIDTYVGPYGAYYAAVGEFITGSGIDGFGAYTSYQDVFFYLERYPSSIHQISLENMANDGVINIGTVLRPNVTGTINIGTNYFGNGKRNIIIGNNVSGSNTTISGNLSITGSSSLIKNSDITLSGKDIILTGSGAQDDWIQLALNTDTYGRIDVYNSGINTQSIDIYAGPTGAVYLGAGDQIPSGLNGSLYAGGTWQKNWVFVESNNGLDYIDLQTVTNGGTINIGTLSKLGESGSINIGTSGSVAGVKAITIGNTLNNSSTTISGNLNITGSNTIIRSNTTITGSIRNSGSLAIFGSGSATPLFDVQGSQGQLFSVTDSLSGSLFSVKDISGMPIVEVFSDNTILQGSFSAPSLNTTVKNVLSATGSFVVYAVPTASYDAAFFEYVARSGSNARAGKIITLWSGSSVNLTETTTTDFGSTSGLTFGSYISGSSMVLTGSATTSGWTIKTIVRSI